MLVPEATKISLEQRFAAQANVWDYCYRQTVLVPNGGSTSVVLTISQDAHFDITEMTGTLRGPVDANGLFVPVVGTDFPDPVNHDYATSGIMFKMTDSGRGIELMNDMVFAETLLSPGYSSIRYQPQRWVYLLQKNATLRIDLRNRDTMAGVGGAQLFHLFTISFKGTKYK